MHTGQLEERLKWLHFGHSPAQFTGAGLMSAVQAAVFVRLLVCWVFVSFPFHAVVSDAVRHGLEGRLVGTLTLLYALNVRRWA